MSTSKAAFGRGRELVNFDKGSPVPLCFVFQLPDELAPSHIRDGKSSAVVLDHVLDLQALDTYDLVLTYESRRKFVLIVTPSMGDLLLYTGNFETSLFPGWREAILVGFLLFHILQYSTYVVKCQTVSHPIAPQKERRSHLPRRSQGFSRARSYKKG
jgi:hypothetical protein